MNQFYNAIIRLRKVGVSTSSLVTFYRSRILSVISYAAPSWFPYLSKGDKEILERPLRLCLRVILPWLEHYDERLAALNLTEQSVYLDICCLKYVNDVRKNTSHPHHHHLHHLATNDRHHHKTTTIPKSNTALCRISFINTHKYVNAFLLLLLFFVVFTWSYLLHALIGG